MPVVVLGALILALALPSAARQPDRYQNPLRPQIAGGGTVDSCADPTVIRGHGRHARSWFMYCTSDPLNDEDTNPDGTGVVHPVPMQESRDLVHWRYVGDALPDPPSWADPDPATRLWAPDIVYSRTFDRYFMTFVVTDTTTAGGGTAGCHNDSAIGVATSRSPLGPWHVSDTPVVAPRPVPGADCDYLWTFDPDVLGNTVGRKGLLYYGSYHGGIFGQHIALTATGMHTTGAARQVAIGERRRGASVPVSPRLETPRMRSLATRPAQQVSIANRYEGANVVRHGGWYYLFGSATNCCNGALTGYSVFAGRSRNPLGPFKDREGHSFLAGRVGGTPVISMNGNRWVGTGHSSAFRDFGGQWWLAFHAVDRDDPYFAFDSQFTKRPALLDPLDWVDGWPTVRSGRWASDHPMPAPAAQPGQHTSYVPRKVEPLRPGRLLEKFSDSFGGDALDPRWTWTHPLDPASYRVGGGRFEFDVQAGDLTGADNTASVLTEPSPDRDFVLQTKVGLDLPAEGCCQNYVQAGLMVYGSDDSFIKLAHVSIWETRQTEFAKEEVTPAGPHYGGTVIGPPGDTTYLRIVRRTEHRHILFTGYTSTDGRTWVRGGTWQDDALRDGARIGLVSMGGAGDFHARFDNVRVSTLRR